MPSNGPRPRLVKRLCLLVLLALAGFLCSGCFATIAQVRRGDRQHLMLAQEIPLPHHVPEFAGGLSFRFAMAHDVIHERFARHGQEHYAERNRLTREAMDQLPVNASERWPLADDLAAGLDRLGKSVEAVEVMRRKLEQQLEQGISGGDLYSTFANLGTFLIHASFAQAVQADAAAVEQFEEGVAFIRQSVEVNPSAHFGRERWQAAIAEFLLAAINTPELLKTFDCLGNRLDLPASQFSESAHESLISAYGRSTLFNYQSALRRAEFDYPPLFTPGFDPGVEQHWEDVRFLRQYITFVGAETGWDEVDVPSHRKPVPFDEPMLGIIGMWRQGGGANPHFALAIAETMLRIGQRYIAWSAYARTKLLAERYSPDPALQRFLVNHCNQRQRVIEDSLPPQQANADNHRQLQSQFEAELAYGQDYQRDYQRFEIRQLAAGIPLAAPDFFADFHAGHPPVASPVGTEESYRYVRRSLVQDYKNRVTLSVAIFGAGCGAMLPLLLSGLMNVLRTAWRR